MYIEHGHAGHPFLHLLVLVLLVALIVLAVYALVRLLRGRPSGSALPAAQAPALVTPDGAVTLVRMRYARGEIGRDDFLRMSTDLGDTSQTGAPAGAEPPGDDAPAPSGGEQL
jgi:uncharacterized membrane protein